MVYKESTFCSWGSAFGYVSAESLLGCLINLLSESFVWARLPHSGDLWLGFRGWCFHLLVTSSASPACWEGCPCQAPLDLLIWGEGDSLLVSWGGEFQLHKGTWKGSGTNLGTPLTRLVKTQVQIQACLRRQKESLINSQRDTLVTAFWGEIMSLRFREWGGSTVLCESVWKCEPKTQPSYEMSAEFQSTRP
jgi:hypothetical protein